jgi:hypothetical protein
MSISLCLQPSGFWSAPDHRALAPFDKGSYCATSSEVPIGQRIYHCNECSLIGIPSSSIQEASSADK